MKKIKTWVYALLLLIGGVITKTSIAQTGATCASALSLTISPGANTGWQNTSYDTIWYSFKAPNKIATFRFFTSLGNKRYLENVVYGTCSDYSNKYEIFRENDTTLNLRFLDLDTTQYYKLGLAFNLSGYCGGCGNTGSYLIEFTSAQAAAAACTATCPAVPDCDYLCNGNFEQINGTPTGFSGIYTNNSCGWISANASTPDLYTTSASMPVSIPTNAFGCEPVRVAGQNAYAGFMVLNGWYEALSTKLRTTLQFGKTYNVSFYLSLAETSPYNPANVGFAFANNYSPSSSNTLFGSHGSTIPINTSGVSKTGWTNFSYNYTATGTETDLVIGAINGGIGSSTPFGGTCSQHYFDPAVNYYYIDDVSIHEIFNFSVTTAPCHTLSTISVTPPNAGTSYTWSSVPITSTLSTQSGYSVSVSPTVTTTYSVSTTTTLGCILSNTVNVQSSPVSLIASSYTFCPGSPLTTTITASGLNTYTWSPNPTISGSLNSPTITVSPTTTTTYTVFGNITGCPNTYSATVTITDLSPSIGINTSSLVCVGAIITVTTTPTYSLTYLDFQSGSYISAPNPYTYSSVGNYTIDVGSEDPVSGCTSYSFFPVTVVSSGTNPTLTITPSMTICAGTTKTLTVSGANSYTWSTGSNSTSITVTPTVTTTYTVTGSTSCGTSTAAVTVSVIPVPSLTLTASPTVICNGNSSVLSATGALTYTWSTSANTSSITVSPTVTTTYTITGASACGTKTAAVTVSVNPTPTITITGTTNICSGNSTTLTAGGASTYTWLPGSSSSNPLTVSPTTNTTYTVTGTNSYGCISTKTITVNVTSSPIITSIPSSNSVCPGSSATLTATGGTSYTWSPGSTLNTTSGSSVIATPTANTIYTVSASTASCGIKTSTVLVSIIPNPTVTANSAVICHGTSTVLTASGATSYTWQPGNVYTSSISVTPTVATVYTVTGVNSCGATSTQTVKVSFFKGVTVTANASPTLICAGSSTTLTASGVGSFVYIQPGSLPSGSVVSPSITTTYTAVGTNTTTGCITSAVITVSVNPFTGLTVTPSTICAGQSSTIAASGASSYTWSTGANTSSIVVSPSVTTIYSLSATGASCTANTTVTLTVNPNPTLTVTASPSVICSGNSSTLTVSGASSYSWSPVSSSSNSLVVTPSVTTIYTVTGTNAAGCSSTRTISISVSPTPTISIAATKTVICTGQTPTLTASGATSYSWSTGATTASVAVTPTAVVTIYTVTGTTGGCSAIKTIVIVKLNTPTLTVVASPTAICSGSSSTLTVTGASTYSWQPISTIGSSTVVSPTVTTIYTVTGSNPGCSTTKTISVNVTTTPTIVAVANPSAYCSGVSPTITASGATNYTWSTGATTSTIAVTPTVATTYTVTGYNGSCYGNTVSINIGVGTTPTITATANPTSMCVGNPATLTATGATSYSWSSGATTAVTTVTPGAVSIYTVTGTTGACSSTATVQIILSGQYCCQTASFTVGTTTTSSINYSNNSNGAGAVIDMQGTVTFTANSTMSNYVIRMAPQTTIFISPSVTVTFSNCTLYSCTELWNGIWIPDVSGDAGNLNVVNSSIEDMYLGIIMFGNSTAGYPTSANGIVTITNSKLNKNYLSVHLNTFPKYNNGSPNYGLSVTGSTISSVYSATSPLSTLKPSSVYTYAYNNITNVSIPYTNFPRGFAGIFLYDLTEAPVIVGDKTGTGGTNRFENLDNGIFVENAYLKAYNNHFINLKGSAKQYASAFPPTSGPPGPDEIGVGITAANTTTTGILYSMIIGDGSSAPSGGNPFPAGNKFENCYKGVKADNYKELVRLKGNVFTTTLTSVTPLMNPTSPLYSYIQGQSGIWLTNTQVKAEVINNYLLNHNTGIYSSHKIDPSYLASAYVKIEDNLVEAPGTTGYTKQAIQVEQIASTTNLNTGMLTVKNNTIQNVYGGIRAYNVKGGLQINANPLINLDAAKLYGITGSVTQPANYARTAIYVMSCTDAIVANNPYITSNGTIPANYSTVKGIWMNQSSGTTGEVSCNVMNNMGRCLQFSQTSLNKVAKNVMYGTYQGFVLSINGQIGSQGSSSLTNDNEWYGFTGGSAPYAETYTEATSNANTNSILFVKPGNPYQPTQNYSSSGFPYVTGSGIQVQSSGVSGETCLALRPVNNSNFTKMDKRTSSNYQTSDVVLYEALACDTTFYEVYPDETQYLNKQLMYGLLNTQSIDSKQILQNFYSTIQKRTYNDFNTVTTSISNGDYMTAKNINNTITAVNIIEAHQKRVNELLLKYMTYSPKTLIIPSLTVPVFSKSINVFDDSELIDLRAIANSCSDQYGSVVTQARVLLTNVSNRVIDFEDNCIPVYNQRKVIQPVNSVSSGVKTLLYPNPNKGIMTMEYDLGIDTKGELRIFNVNGQVISSYNLTQAVGKIEINEANLVNGVYYYSVILNGKIAKTDKIIIIK
ncbi:MAG: T9SS type A sorting domain-containing protein [Bacteroidota bacterium]